MSKFEIKKILIPVDFSETAELALDHAVYMAKLYKAEIILLHVHETLMYTSGIDYSMLAVNIEYETAIEKNAREKLDNMGDSIFRQHNLQVKTIFEPGRVYSKIVDVADEIGADIIIMGTHGVSGFQEFFIGSNTYRVVTSSPCPVLSVQTHSKRMGFKNIVLPIDDSFASRQKVVHAIEIATKYGSTVHIAGLMTDDDAAFVRRFHLKVEQVEDFLKDHKVSFTTRFIEGENLAEMAMNYGNELDADLIIIMTEQEPNIKGIFMGPYAQQIVNHSKIPVLSIRPEVREYENQSFNPI
jgi:nucleotide-binding universal stress UspA family protein